MTGPVANVVNAAAISAVIGVICWWKALRRLSPTGQRRKGRILLWSKLFAGRENFTEEGWKYWVWARLATLAFVILVFAGGIVGATTS